VNNRYQKVDIIIKDYEILKNYSTTTQPGIRYNLISIALATIGIVISGTTVAISSRGDIGVFYRIIAPIVATLWIAFIPAFSMTMLSVWIGEEQRMMRAGKYLKLLEEAINKELGENILYWETFKRRYSIQYPEVFIIALFLGLSLGASLAGLFLIYLIFKSYFDIISGIAIFDIVVHSLIARHIYKYAKGNILALEKLT